MIQEVSRLYHVPDEQVTVLARAMHSLLAGDDATPGHLSLFMAMFTAATPAELEAFEAVINTADALPLDGQVTDNIAVFSADLAAQVALGSEALAILDVYAKEAYPTDLKRQRIFGQDDRDAARYDPEKMRNALEQAYTESHPDRECGAAIRVKGYTTVMRERMNQTAQAIRDKQSLQKSAQKHRPISTQDRILANNAVWRYMQSYNNRAKAVFANDAARRKAYNLYPPAAPAGGPSVSVTVYKAGTTEALPGAVVTIEGTGLAAQTTGADGKASFTTTEFPELMSIRVEHATEGVGLYTGLGYDDGGDQVFVLEVPHGEEG